MREMRHKNRLSGKGALSDGKQLTHNAFVRRAPVAHFCLKGNVLLDVVHCASLGNNCLAWIQLNLDDLHVVAENLVVNFM